MPCGYRFGYIAGYRNFRNADGLLPEALETRVSQGYLGDNPSLSANHVRKVIYSNQMNSCWRETRHSARLPRIAIMVRSKSKTFRKNMAPTAWPSDIPGARLNDSVTEGNCP